MRILIDENFPRLVGLGLQKGRNDVVFATIAYAGFTDRKLLDLAEAQSRILFTLDKDFQQLALRRRAPIERCGVILFRIHPPSRVRLRPIVDAIMELDREWNGSISIVTERGIEMLRPTSPRQSG